jgi:hypothetical protein
MSQKKTYQEKKKKTISGNPVNSVAPFTLQSVVLTFIIHEVLKVFK